MTISFDTVFAAIPSDLYAALEKHYYKIKLNFARQSYEPSELNGGKFCEIVYRVIEWQIDGKYTPLGKTISNFGEALRKLENKSGASDSLRLHIPRVLNAVYDFRNKRGVAHHAGEVDSNHMDATLVVASTDWVMAELVRILHNLLLKV